jgi:hypothetical protein
MNIKKISAIFIIVLCAMLGSCKKSTPMLPTLTASPEKILPKIDSFTASATEIAYNGPVTLAWSTQDATHIVITPIIGDVAASGTKQLSLTTTTAFTLTAENNDGAATQQVQVKVDFPDECKTIAVQSWTFYSTFVHVWISPNYSLRNVVNVEVTVNMFDANNKIVDWGKGTIPIIKPGEMAEINIFFDHDSGLNFHHSTLTITNCGINSISIKAKIR